MWVTQYVPNTAMIRFAQGRVPRRHAAHAPGPLEARKRATKRRMMNLAQDGGGGGLDPSVLAGLGSPGRMDWKWRIPQIKDGWKDWKWRIPQIKDDVAPLPSWLIDPASLEADRPLPIEDAEKEGAFEQLRWGRKNRLGTRQFWIDLKDCNSIDAVYSLAAIHSIDVRTFSPHLFRGFFRVAKSLPLLLCALQDTALGHPANFRYLLFGSFRERRIGLRLQLIQKPNDLALLQQWMHQQLYLGRKSEEDILIYLEFISRLDKATSDESLKFNLIKSLQGLQSSPVFGLKDLGQDAQYRIIELITRGPITRNLLEIGFSFLEAMPYLQLQRTDQKISAFIRSVVRAHASRPDYEKQEVRFLEVTPTILRTLWGLPMELRDAVILTTTKALIDDHLCMSANDATTMQLPKLWLSALFTELVSESWNLKVSVESFLGSQKPEVIIPYLRQLEEENKASFILRYQLGFQDSTAKTRALYRFNEYCLARPDDSPWINMLLAARQFAQESLQPLNAQVSLLFKTLQMLRQFDTIVGIVKHSKLDTIVTENDVVYAIKEYLAEQPNLAVLLFHFHPGLRLEKCPELAEHMILNRRHYPNTAVRYLRRRSSRFFIPRSRSARVYLLEVMAHAFSMASHLTPGMAYRRVYKCYAQHRTEKLGPLSVVMARALTRAGLIRPLEVGQWIRITQVRWLLSVVRSTEGEDVADRLYTTVYKWQGGNRRGPRHSRLNALRATEAMPNSKPLQHP